MSTSSKKKPKTKDPIFILLATSERVERFQRSERQKVPRGTFGPGSGSGAPAPPAKALDFFGT